VSRALQELKRRLADPLEEDGWEGGAPEEVDHG